VLLTCSIVYIFEKNCFAYTEILSNNMSVNVFHHKNEYDYIYSLFTLFKSFLVVICIKSNNPIIECRFC